MFGFVFFVAMFLVGDYFSARFSLPIPGSIIGLGLTLCVLLARRKVDHSLKQAANVFARYLPLMLVPIGVSGVVRLVGSPPPGVWRLITVLVIALVLGAVGTAKLMLAALRLCGVSTAELQPLSDQRADSAGGEEA